MAKCDICYHISVHDVAVISKSLCILGVKATKAPFAEVFTKEKIALKVHQYCIKCLKMYRISTILHDM